MATAFLSSASTSTSSSFLLKTKSLVYYPHNDNARRLLILSKAASESPHPSLVLTKRNLSISLVTSFVFTLAGKGSSNSNAAILEADDDEELMEKVKKDRKKRLERQGVINSSNKETGLVPSLFQFKCRT